MINPNATWRPTDAMGQGVPISSELQKDQIIFISDITKPKPVSIFTESQYASGCKDVADRITILWNQQGWVATDEMAFYLTKLHEWGPPTSPPLQATSMEDLNSCLGEWIMSVLEEACQAQKKKSRRTAVLVNQHWTPVMVEAGPNEIHIHTTKYGETMFQSLPDLMSFEDLSWHTDTVKSHFPYDCGFQAFAWLQGYATGGIAMPMSIIQAIAMREEFELHCLAKPSAQPFELGGVLDEKLFKQLQALLETHGVARHYKITCSRIQLGLSFREPKRDQCIECPTSVERPQDEGKHAKTSTADCADRRAPSRSHQQSTKWTGHRKKEQQKDVKQAETPFGLASR